LGLFEIVLRRLWGFAGRNGGLLRPLSLAIIPPPAPRRDRCTGKNCVRLYA